MNKRALSKQMFDDFKNEEGKLHSLLTRVLKDDTLSLEFRGGGFSDAETNVSYKEGANVYYRGSSLFYIEKKTMVTFSASTPSTARIRALNCL